MMHLSPCLRIFSEDCESITKGASMVEPDINNDTTTDESECNTGFLLEVQI